MNRVTHVVFARYFLTAERFSVGICAKAGVFSCSGATLFLQGGRFSINLKTALYNTISEMADDSPPRKFACVKNESTGVRIYHAYNEVGLVAFVIYTVEEDSRRWDLPIPTGISASTSPIGITTPTSRAGITSPTSIKKPTFPTRWIAPTSPPSTHI